MKLQVFILLLLIFKSHPWSCQSGWTLSNRKILPMCLKIFEYERVKLPDAMKECEAKGASLVGVENEQELALMQDVAMKWNNGKHGAVSSFVVAGRRKKRCGYYSKTMGRNCRTMEQFEWIDGYTMGEVNFKWAHKQPDNYKNESCLHFRPFLYSQPEFNDIGCTIMNTIVGYVCGKPANP